MYLKSELSTNRFILRSLSEKDATQRYLDWFDDADVKKHIIAASKKQSVKSLQEFIARCNREKQCLLLGIFEKKGNHIGNVKFEPIDFKIGVAIMGIIIGDSNWRGKGVTGEVISCGAKYLKNKYEIKEIELGVSEQNESAVKAYQKMGFRQVDNPKIIKGGREAIIMNYKIDG